MRSRHKGAGRLRWRAEEERQARNKRAQHCLEPVCLEPSVPAAHKGSRDTLVDVRKVGGGGAGLKGNFFTL